MSSQFLIVLTGTIVPAAGATVARNDPSLRRSDYLTAFTYWLNHSDARFGRILFIENSGSDLSEFHELASRSAKQVEIISISPNPPPTLMHYGYSELEMIDKALAQSKLRQQTTHMIKATGRLIFPALAKMLDKLPEGFRICVDARARMPFRPSERGFISVQLFVVEHQFYDEHLRTGYTALAPSKHYPYFIEHLFFERLEPYKGQKDILLRFPINCEPVGFAGHATKQYNSASRILVTKARGFLRVVAPDFWF